MDLQFPPSWIKFSNYRHQCAPPWDALAVDASILITQPRAFDFKIDWVLTNRAVAVITVITFPPQGLQGSANLAFNSRYHTQTALDDIAEAEKSSRTTSFIASICIWSGSGSCARTLRKVSFRYAALRLQARITTDQHGRAPKAFVSRNQRREAASEWKERHSFRNSR